MKPDSYGSYVQHYKKAICCPVYGGSSSTKLAEEKLLSCFNKNPSLKKKLILVQLLKSFTQ